MGGSSTDYSSSSDYNFSSSSKVTKKSARDYAKEDKREYKAPAAKGLPSILGKDISTDSQLALTIILDNTGSMKGIPKLFIDKISTFYAEANAAFQGKSIEELEKKNTLEDKLDIAVAVINDAKFSKKALQVLPYCHGSEFVKGVQGIFPEGNGGPSTEESYELGAYFLLNHSQTPKVPTGKSPLIIIGDELFYPNLSASEVKTYIGDDLPKDLKTEDVMRALAKKFDAYVLRPEISYSEGEYAVIQKQWESIFGAQRVMRMNDYGRLVDCIIGICGYASNNFKVSEDLLKRRQTPAQVDEVLRIMHPLFAKPIVKKSGGKK